MIEKEMYMNEPFHRYSQITGFFFKFAGSIPGTDRRLFKIALMSFFLIKMKSKK